MAAEARFIMERNFQVFVGFVRLMALLRLICSHSDIVYVGWCGGVGGASAMQGNYLGKLYIISLSDLIDDEGPTPI